MEDLKKINILQEIQSITKDIEFLIIEKIKTNNNFNEKLDKLFVKLDNLNLELKRHTMPIKNNEIN
jgi:hypothetical protein